MTPIPTDSLGARYYAPSLGRFLTSDWSEAPEPVPFANLENPQSLNPYESAGNNPVTITDPDGHYWPTQIHDEIYAAELPGLSRSDLAATRGSGRRNPSRLRRDVWRGRR